MIVRGKGYGELFIRSDTLSGIRFYDSDLIIDFHGFRIELKEEEARSLREALCYLNKFSRDSLVFENEGSIIQPKYKMMRWYYDSEKNHGGPVELRPQERTVK